MALPVTHPFHERNVTGSALSVATGISGVMRAPFRGKVLQLGTMIGSVVSTADATCTVSIAGTAVTGGSFVITQSGSAIGDLDFVSTDGIGANGAITAVNNCNEGDLINFAFTGSGTAGGHVHCYAIIRPA